MLRVNIPQLTTKPKICLLLTVLVNNLQLQGLVKCFNINCQMDVSSCQPSLNIFPGKYLHVIPFYCGIYQDFNPLVEKGKTPIVRIFQLLLTRLKTLIDGRWAQ